MSTALEKPTEEQPKSSIVEMTRLYRFYEIGSLKPIERAGASPEEPKTYRIAISTESEVQRWFGKETLGHGPGEIDLSLARSGLALILDHYGEQVGVVENIRLEDDRVLRGDMRFSRSALGQQIEQDVVDGIRKYISVGYDPIAVNVTEAAESLRDRKVRVKRWKPLETSIVKIPADPKAGVGRDGTGPATFPVEIEGYEPTREVRSMSAAAPAVTTTPATPATVTVTEDWNARSLEYMDLASANDKDGALGLQGRTREWIEKKMAREDVLKDILSIAMKARGETRPSIIKNGAEQVIDLPEKDRRSYSYRKALLAAIDQYSPGFRFEGLEAEVHQELLKRSKEAGISPNPRAFLAPTSLYSDEEMLRMELDRQTRNLDSQTVTKGAELIQDQQPRQFLELLRNKSVLNRMGAQIYTGLSGGNIPWVVQTGGLTGKWVGEKTPQGGGGVTGSDITFGLKWLAPKSRMAKTGWTRQLVAQTSFGVEAKVRNEFATEMALEYDRAGLHGKGGSEPVGLYNWPGIATETFGAVPTYDKLVEMQGKIDDKNANFGAMGYVMTSLMAAKLKATPEHATLSAAGWIWRGKLEDGEVAGYRAMTSQQLSKEMSTTGLVAPGSGTAHGLVFGNFSTIVQGFWGSLEILVDPFSMKEDAIIEAVAFLMGDDLIEYPQALVAGIDARLS